MALLTDERFEKLNLPQLRALAKTFKVNLNGKTKKSEVIDDLLGSGVTWDMYVALSNVPDEPVVVGEPFDLPVEEPEVTEATVNDTAAPVEPPVFDLPVADPVVPVREPDPFEEVIGDLSEFDEPEPLPVIENAVTPDTVLVPVAVEPEPEVEYTLIKMTRENRIFERYGYRFTREAPYMLVEETAADKLIEDIGGFRRASSREVKEFYGG